MPAAGTTVKQYDTLTLDGWAITFGFPLSSTWPHLRCDVGLEEGEY